MTQADPGGEDGSVLEFKLRFAENEYMLMEGALGTRLKAEYGLEFDEAVAMAGLVYQENAREALGRLWGEYYQVAAAAGWPFLATTPTRRANRERVRASRFSPERIIGDNVDFLKEVRLSCQEGPRAGAFAPPMYIGGLMGCRGDAYRADQALTPEEGESFHRWQAERFAGAGVDFLYAGIMPALPEAIGMAKAMRGQVCLISSASWSAGTAGCRTGRPSAPLSGKSTGRPVARECRCAICQTAFIPGFWRRPWPRRKIGRLGFISASGGYRPMPRPFRRKSWKHLPGRSRRSPTNGRRRWRSFAV